MPAPVQGERCKCPRNYLVEADDALTVAIPLLADIEAMCCGESSTGIQAMLAFDPDNQVTCTRSQLFCWAQCIADTAGTLLDGGYPAEAAALGEAAQHLTLAVTENIQP